MIKKNKKIHWVFKEIFYWNHKVSFFERENLKSGVYFSFSVSPKNQQELRYIFFSLLCLCLLIKHTCGLDSLRRCKEVWKKKRKRKKGVTQSIDLSLCP